MTSSATTLTVSPGIRPESADQDEIPPRTVCGEFAAETRAQLKRSRGVSRKCLYIDINICFY